VRGGTKLMCACVRVIESNFGTVGVGRRKMRVMENQKNKKKREKGSALSGLVNCGREFCVNAWGVGGTVCDVDKESQGLGSTY
jgi:hypothetical protein